MRYAITIVSPPGYKHSEAFREVAQTLDHGLRALGVDSVVTDELEVPGRQHVVLGANLLARMKATPAAGSILYNLEQIDPGSAWLSKPFLALLSRYPVWDYSRRNIEQLRRLGVSGATYVPIGYVPELTRIEKKVEDLDVLFFGSMNARRLEVLLALEKRGVNVHAVFGCYGAARDALIARAKIVLNLHFYEAKVFEAVRVSYLLANQRFVVSETGADPEEERPLEGGVAFAGYDALVETCEWYLRRPDERERVARRGFEVFSQQREAEILASVIGPSPRPSPRFRRERETTVQK